MSTSLLLPLLVVWFAAIASPGPDIVQIIRMGSKSRSNGVWTAIGIMVGNSLWIIASLLGLSALIATTPSILAALQLIGGAYLMWMGYGAVRSWWRQRAVQVAQVGVVTHAGVRDGPVHSAGAGAALRTGIATNLSNPKRCCSSARCSPSSSGRIWVRSGR
jgi:Putative threonine efflux protein